MQEKQEDVVRDIVVVHDSLLLFSEIMRESGLKVGGARGEDGLVAEDRLTFYHESNIAELLLVKD